MQSDQPTNQDDEQVQEEAEELFQEGAAELRADVDEAMAAVHRELPESEAVWEVSAENTLGVLNTLRSELKVEDAEAHLREAKKWYLLGKEAGVFGDEARAEIEHVEEVIGRMKEADALLADLSAEVPQLRSELADLEESESGR